LNAFAFLLSGLLVFQPGAQTTTAQPAPSGPVSITVGQPDFGFNVIGNSVRRIFATVSNGSTSQVQWAVKSGSGKISSSSGSWVDVTAPPTGTACSYVVTNGQYSVKSATQFTIEATSVDDKTKVADVVFNVCNQAVNVSVVPFYRTLYANQMADVQSLILGSTDQSVHWAISSQPSGGDGKLSDSTSRDTVFTGTVRGRYTLKATSNADPSKSQTAIMYVTGNAMPYRVTPNQTEPVDCTADPASTGKVYEVGPSQDFKTLASVPFPTIAPGSTVRVHNEDTSGTQPTEYHEYVQISQTAAPDQPFRMCGVPDSTGHLPIIDAANATGRSDTSQYVPGYGLLVLHNQNYWAWWPDFHSAAYIAVEGLAFRNAELGKTFVAPDGSTGQWGDAACIRINQGHNTSFVGNDVSNCGDGAFTNFNTQGGWGSSDVNVLWEGNYFHDNGNPGSYLDHQLYLQAWGEVVQFNRIDNYKVGAFGSNLKSRGIQSIIRYNYLGDGAARQMDLVDVQDAQDAMTFAAYLGGGATSERATEPQQNIPPDWFAAQQEAYNSHFVYGNIYINKSSQVPIHFGFDHSGLEPARKGSLYWYNNTFYEKLCPECQGQSWTLFDTSAGGGNFYPQTEFQTVQAFNNIIWMDDPAKPVFQWNNSAAFIGVSGKNLLPTGWGSNSQVGGSGTGWGSGAIPYLYQNAEQLAQHLTGFTSSNIVTAGSMPFDPNTWILNSNVAGDAAVPNAVCQMPSRFAFLPNLNVAVPRIATPNVGATDTAAQTATQMSLIAAGSRYTTHLSACR